MEHLASMRTLAARLCGAALAAVVFLAPGSGTAAGGDAHVFAVGLRGDPEVGCIVTTGDDPCHKDRVRGTVFPDGNPALFGDFSFKIPAVGEDGALVRGTGRGELKADFTAGPGAATVHCTFTGRVRAHGVQMPPGASSLRFYTGTFQARGRCGSQPAVMKAIWSGAVINSDGPFIFSFERFEGRLAGSIRFAGRRSARSFYLP